MCFHVLFVLQWKGKKGRKRGKKTEEGGGGVKKGERKDSKGKQTSSIQGQHHGLILH